LTQYGWRKATYCVALSSGNPVEKNDIRKSLRRVSQEAFEKNPRRKKKASTEKQNEVQSITRTFKIQNEDGAPMKALKKN